MKRLTIILILLSYIQWPGFSGVPGGPSDDETSCLISDNKHLTFRNINKLDFFQDPEMLEKIKKLKGNRDEEQFSAMLDYIGQFGPVNFKNDSRVIWETAKLASFLGYYGEAASLYKLVLRHHHTNIEFSELRKVHDSLNHLENSQYVPLDYFYKIAANSNQNQVDKITSPHSFSTNLGGNINSPGPDYAPAYHPGTQSLIFTSQRGIPGFGQEKVAENLYISTRDSSGNWSKAKKMDHISSIYNEGSGCLDNEGKTLFFSRCNSPDSYGNCDLFVAYLQADSSWGNIQNLGPEVNSKAWDSHPTLSPSGDTLYFSSDRAGGFGQTDLYYTYKSKHGKWKAPKNMGPVVNTKQHDLSPFYHPEYHVLYFSSNGQPNSFGQFDIYKVSKKCEHAWGDPINAGPHVNHAGSEMYFSIDPASNQMYFARSANHQLSKQDLYSFPLPMEAHPANTVKLTGTLSDTLNNTPLQGIVSVIDLEHGIEVAPKYTDKNGTFEFDLIDKRKYLLVVRGKDYFRVEMPFSLDGPMSLQPGIEMVGNAITFSSIHFDFDSASIKEYMQNDLEKVTKFLFDNPDYVLHIEGHTDSEGSNEYNKDLSSRRAGSIRSFIISQGIDPHRVTFDGLGNDRPLINEPTEEAHAKNRRVEFHFSVPGLGDHAKSISNL